MTSAEVSVKHVYVHIKFDLNYSLYRAVSAAVYQMKAQINGMLTIPITFVFLFLSQHTCTNCKSSNNSPPVGRRAHLF